MKPRSKMMLLVVAVLAAGAFSLAAFTLRPFIGSEPTPEAAPGANIAANPLAAQQALVSDLLEKFQARVAEYSHALSLESYDRLVEAGLYRMRGKELSVFREQWLAVPRLCEVAFNLNLCGVAQSSDDVPAAEQILAGYGVNQDYIKEFCRGYSARLAGVPMWEGSRHHNCWQDFTQRLDGELLAGRLERADLAQHFERARSLHELSTLVAYAFEMEDGLEGIQFRNLKRTDGDAAMDYVANLMELLAAKLGCWQDGFCAPGSHVLFMLCTGRVRELHCKPGDDLYAIARRNLSGEQYEAFLAARVAR